MLKAFESIKGLGMAQLSRIIAAAAVVVGVAILLALAYSGAEYRPLYTGHDAGGVAAVVERLKVKGVSYKTDGYTISVPDDMLSTASRYIESASITQTAPAGFEIFDRSGFFLSEFAQRVNYSRALSGELAKTIGQIDGVEGARVHLVLPEKGIFGVETSGKAASAAVIITLKQDAVFTTDQAEAVAYLVAASVPMLKLQDVTVVDTFGRLLVGGHGAQARADGFSDKRGDGIVITRKADNPQAADVSNPPPAPPFPKWGSFQPPFFKGGSAPRNGDQSWVYLVYIAAAVIVASLAGLFIWMMGRRKAVALSDEDAARLAGEFIAAVGKLYNESGKAASDSGVLTKMTVADAGVVDVINRAPVSVIIEAFKAEHPQVLAAVLSLLSVERAAEMLEAFPEETRQDIKRRAAKLAGLLPAALRDIARVIKGRERGSLTELS